MVNCIEGCDVRESIVYSRTDASDFLSAAKKSIDMESIETKSSIL